MSDRAVASRKRDQARRATAAGPPPGFAPVEPEAPIGSTGAPAEPAPAPQPARSISFSGPDWGDGGGFLFGLLSYALVLAYIRHGKAGVIGWFKAKLINEPTVFNDTPAGPQHITPGVNQPQYSIPYDGKQ